LGIAVLTIGNLAGVGSVLQAVLGFFSLAVAVSKATTVRDRVVLVVEYARKVAKSTPNAFDDALVALVDRLGVENAVELVEIGLQVIGYDGVESFGAMDDSRLRTELASKAQASGVSLSGILAAVQAVRMILELIRQWRQQADSGETFPTPVFEGPSV
jgi:hypothetical protein